MEQESRFYVGRRGPSGAVEKVMGPISDDDVRDGVREGTLEAGTVVRRVDSDLWAAPIAWATFRVRRTQPEPPPPPREIAEDLSPDLASAPEAVLDMLVYFVAEERGVFGPVRGDEIREALAAGRHAHAAVSILDSDIWYPARLLFGGNAARIARALVGPDSAAPERLAMRCPTCLETIPFESEVCPECDEPTSGIAAPPPSGPLSIPDDRPDATWLEMHWRPLFTIGAIMTMICAGVALRYLAPGRMMPPAWSGKPAAAAALTCSTPCWGGETCQKGTCTWQPPGDVGHMPDSPAVAGPFPLPKDVSDGLQLDAERFAVALLTGTEIRNARTGEVLSLVSEAPQSRRLYRIGDVVYATAPQRIYVIDAATTRLLKTIELGATASTLTVGASGRRVLASLPNAHAVAVLATEYSAEIDRIQFGDDPVGPVGTDDTGKRALVTTGQVPLPGLRDPAGGALYAFDPSRLATQQDRVRAAVPGNPVSVLMSPDGEASWVVLRAESTILPLAWQPSGAVAQGDRIATCREPEQIELVRSGRRAAVRCFEGRALEVFDIAQKRALRHVPFEMRAADMALSPDGAQAVVALAGEGSGAVAFVDLATYAVKIVPLTADANRVRLAPDGKTALVISDRNKVAWVLR